MKLICSEEKCTGCGLCVSLCNKSAISLSEKKITGHFIPVIDEEKCVDCGLCQKKCPANNSVELVNPKAAYAAWRKNKDKQKGSSSGGVAAALYEAAIAEKWYIVGTYLDENLLPKLKLSHSLEDVAGFKGSKYVQAKPEKIYREIKKVIDENNNVLFIGTPCQCQAARNACNGNEALYTVELICHGVPSQKIFREYIEYIEDIKKKKVTYLSFRSAYGEELTMKAEDKIIWKRKRPEDFYLTAFNEGIILNDACYQCRYAVPQRGSDLTIGDFWGIGRDEPFKDPGCKVSVIAVNTKKGEKLLKICDDIEISERKYIEAVNGNAQLKAPKNKSYLSDLFWAEYTQSGVGAALKATIYKSVQHECIVRKIRQFPKVIVKKILRRE